jgi:hypothetical protein
MSIFFIILLILALLIAAFLIGALFTRKEYAVTRDIIVNQSKQKVFDYIRYLRNQDSFSKWANMDPTMKKEYKGTDGTIGFVSAWDSTDKKVGKGEQEIIGINDGERIDFDLRFIRPFPGVAKAYMSTENLSESVTRVKWGIASGMKYPMNLMLLFMNMDKIMGNDLEIGLNNLKTILEKE